MTGRPNGLRAARTALGWSQTDAARELAALGRARGAPVAAAVSLKTLLSRWENGHAVPEPQYRSLLGELFDRTTAELGLGPATAEPCGTTAATRLRDAVAGASAVDDVALGLWREQLAVARRLDDELGAAGAGGLVRAQVEQLGHTLSHTVGPATRRLVAEVLAGAATLAGAQALDGADHEEAWLHYDRARAAAREAGLPLAAVVALTGQAAVLVEVGDPTSASTLLGERCPDGPAAARARWQAARGTVRAAAGDGTGSGVAFAAAERELQLSPTEPRADVVTWTGPPIELTDLDRWHGRALVALGAATHAVTPLERALAARPRSARHRAALHADLAAALGAERPTDAARHAHAARALAARIGSERITARLARAPGSSRRVER